MPCLEWLKDINNNYGNLLNSLVAFIALCAVSYFAYIQTKINNRQVQNDIIQQYNNHYIRLISVIKEYIQLDMNKIIVEFDINKKIFMDFQDYKLIKNKFLDILYESNLFESELIKNEVLSVKGLMDETDRTMILCCDLQEAETKNKARATLGKLLVTFDSNYKQITNIYKQEIERIRQVQIK